MSFIPADISGVKYCPTEDVWKWKKSVMNAGKKPDEQLACAVEGPCDVPDFRNKWTDGSVNIGLIFNTICTTLQNCPFNNDRINAQVQQINIDFAGTGFRFYAHEINFIANSSLAEISAYGSNPQWYYDILAVKSLTAKQPNDFLNVFVTRQRAGLQGTLLGIGTFPWDPESKTEFGGLWMNANYIGLGQKTLSHEIGHNIGLWHAFHGINEVGCNTDCYEPVHNETDEFSAPNTYGDFCADTLSQPMNYNCAPPATRDCRGTLYTNINSNLIPELTNNIMAYTPDTCMQKFTQQQSWRGYCWVCKEFPRWTPFCPSIPFETK
jgi:hypothetical protein